MAGQLRHRWAVAGWITAVVATAVNGVVVGYGAVWFQLFGETADATDYQVSAGGYAAAAAVLGLTVPATLAHRAPRWLRWPAAGGAVVLTALALAALASSHRAERDLTPVDTVWTGVAGVLWAPWTWVLVALGVRGVHRLLRRRDPGASTA